jgi:predicted RNA binding protein YcfA (HicA-like mRNA interferase family)
MSEASFDLVEWMISKGEVDFDAHSEIAGVSGHRIPGNDDFNQELLDEESREQIAVERLGIDSNSGINPNPQAREQIEKAIGSGPARISGSLHVLAWYQPISYYGHDWGIYITTSGLLEVATGIAGYVKKSEPFVIEKCLYAAFLILYSHEKFHHRTESFAVRSRIVSNKSCYRMYSKNVYQPSFGSSSGCLEEQLAMATMMRDLNSSSRSKQLGANVRKATRLYLEDLFHSIGGAYQNASHFVPNLQFEEQLDNLLSQCQEGSATPVRTQGEWPHASHISRPLFTVAHDIWEITSAGYPSILPHNPPLSVSRKRIENELRARGFAEKRSAGKGSHAKWSGPTGQMIIIPLGKEIFESTAASIAKSLQIPLTELTMRT